MRKLSIFGTICCVFALMASCTDMLNEEPRSVLTPAFFKTTQGIEKGLTAAYSGLRFQYGPQGAMTLTVPGTDEATYGGDGDARNENDYGNGLNNSGHLTTPWNRNYTFINTCSGIVEFGPATGRNDLVAEAKFLRAQYYLNLVTTFGGVPLDLGSGRLKYNDNPVSTSERNTVLEVYQAIVEDFEAAISDLPNIQSVPGRVGKAAALHYLAKTYLSMACYYQYDYSNELGSWEAPQPNPSKAAEYYALALSTAKQLLDNRSTYGVELLSDFADVNKAGNEHNKEVIFLIEHTTDYTFDESAPGTGGPENGLKENRANFMMCPYYEEHGALINGAKLMIRSREYGRGWRRFVPTNHLLNTAFADKINDTRYYKSFQSVWKCNDASKAGIKKDNGEFSKVGDIAIYMPGYTSRAAAPAIIQAEIDKVISEGGRVWYANQYTRNMFPANLKLADPLGGNEIVNDPSHRPFLAAKLSETILIAAEAALMTGGDPTPYINELRLRAAVGNQYADEATAKAAMTVSQSRIDLTYILDERSRELCCEQHRWFDLVRTNQLISRLQSGLNVFLPGDEDNASKNVRRYHYLRAIPQSQIDAMSNENKADYQNPGYR